MGCVLPLLSTINLVEIYCRRTQTPQLLIRVTASIYSMALGASLWRIPALSIARSHFTPEARLLEMLSQSVPALFYTIISFFDGQPAGNFCGASWFRFQEVERERERDLLPIICSFTVGDALPTDEALEVSDDELVRPWVGPFEQCAILELGVDGCVSLNSICHSVWESRLLHSLPVGGWKFRKEPDHRSSNSALLHQSDQAHWFTNRTGWHPMLTCMNLN